MDLKAVCLILSFASSPREELDVYNIYSGNYSFFQSLIPFWSWQDNCFHTQASPAPLTSHTTSNFARLSPVWFVCFREVCCCFCWLLGCGMGAAFPMFPLDTTVKPYESIMHHPLAPMNNLCPSQLVSIRSLQRFGSQERAVGVRQKTENIYLFLKKNCLWSHSEL